MVMTLEWLWKQEWSDKCVNDVKLIIEWNNPPGLEIECEFSCLSHQLCKFTAELEPCWWSLNNKSWVNLCVYVVNEFLKPDQLMDQRSMLLPLPITQKSWVNELNLWSQESETSWDVGGGVCSRTCVCWPTKSSRGHIFVPWAVQHFGTAHDTHFLNLNLKFKFKFKSFKGHTIVGWNTRSLYPRLEEIDA